MGEMGKKLLEAAQMLTHFKAKYHCVYLINEQRKVILHEAENMASKVFVESFLAQIIFLSITYNYQLPIAFIFL